MSDAKKDPLPLAAQLTKGIDSVDFHEFAGGIAREMATLPQIRVGKKWYTTAPKDSQLDVDKLGIKALLEPSAPK